MALSQLQCLDEQHVNLRVHEAKVNFLYCEDQRLALEALLQDGREALGALQRARGLRGFLSDPEMEALSAGVQPYDPGAELLPGDPEDGDPPLSLQYWPELSDTSVPQMDLGWPEAASYRGVTRATVYAQPPMEGQTHIKEVVRKMIAQAQKVIAVVMDVFTDVDIFRDLLDAGFKRRVSVYILLERTSLPHFLSMCQRANMHAGQLKHLRVRCSEGTEFCTRSCSRVKGQLGHRFMFIDGDKALSGSYSFTWMSSRLDRNLVTVVTGQAVDSFDTLFRFLYATSSSVDLRPVATDPELEPEPIRQPAPVAPPSAADLRKMYNPKYAVLMAGNPTMNPPTGPKEPQKSENPEVPGSKKRGQRKISKEASQEAPPLHPGLSHLEKANLISYIPTWPEPDPASDVIGFINVRDSSKPIQVHLQRTERFETSQAVRFSSPFSMPKEILPEVAQLRQSTPNQEETHKATQNKANAEECVVDGNQATRPSAAPEEKSPTSGPKSEPVKDTNQALDTVSELHSNTPTNRGTGHNTTPHLSAHTPSASSSNTSPPNTGRSSHSAQTLTTSSPEPRSLPGSNAEQGAETSLNKQSAAVQGTHTLQLGDSEQHTQTKTEVLQADSHAQPHNSSETPNVQTSTSSASPPPVTSTSLSKELHTASTAVHTRTATSVCISVPSIPPPISSSTTLQPPLPASSAPPPSSPAAPIPKPRTVHLVINSGRTIDGHEQPEISVVSRPGTPVRKSEKETPPQGKEPESVQQPQNNSGSKTGAGEKAGNIQSIKGNPKEAPQQKQNATSQETKDAVTDGPHGDREATQSSSEAKHRVQSDGSTADAPKVPSVNIQEITPKEVEPESLTPSGSKIPPKKESGRAAAEQTDTKAPEKTSDFTEVPNDKGENVVQGRKYLARAHEPQRILYCEVNAPESAAINAHVPKDSQQGRSPGVAAANHIHIKPQQNTHISITALESQLTPRAQGGSHTNTQVTAERELLPIISPVRTPTPDGSLPRTPTPDSRTHTPDPRAYTPDSQTPTPDGYMSPRDDSNLSTTSDEYYECSSSPLHDPVFERAGFHNHGTTADPDSSTLSNGPTCTAASPVHVNNTTWAENDADKNEKMIKLSVTERPDEEQVEDDAALRPSGGDGRDRPQSPREAERQKSPRPQQQDGGPSPHRPPRPPPVGAVGSATGRKQVEVPNIESRMRTGQLQKQLPNPRAPAPGVNTHWNTQSHLRPHSQNQEESVQGALRQEEGKAPFTLTLSKMYNLTGLKDNMSKLPAQGRGGSGGRKSTY
ncbi:nascent polypeptide-associated complex subunit alpha, muscle-specific form-like isoform X1 [Limanda limanda]|uniref:nascent polypeptide-associated complex subunit alpha, muscle-specific form-like isoform X1 n=1 Tax=Limanda limanda TaxID=27771 RepID=UPI0029C9B09C|nr:nascent polypeptide-associated complex subunit alpha, muscle-specific form-like isoform X1 [Limanda limanda]